MSTDHRPRERAALDDPLEALPRHAGLGGATTEPQSPEPREDADGAEQL